MNILPERENWSNECLHSSQEAAEWIPAEDSLLDHEDDLKRASFLLAIQLSPSSLKASHFWP